MCSLCFVWIFRQDQWLTPHQKHVFKRGCVRFRKSPSIRKHLLEGHKFKDLVYQTGLTLRKRLLVSQRSSVRVIVKPACSWIDSVIVFLKRVWIPLNAVSNGGEVINPPKTTHQVEKEADEGHQLYIHSHGSYFVGQLLARLGVSVFGLWTSVRLDAILNLLQGNTWFWCSSTDTDITYSTYT